MNSNFHKNTTPVITPIVTHQQSHQQIIQKKMQNVMKNHKNIRNMSVIAHVDHGKTTLTDSLLNKAGIISDKDTGKKCGTDTDKQEQDRGITIFSTGVSLEYTLPDDKVPKDSNGNAFLINLIDSPGHVDFNCEVTAALRVTDGALVVVDAIEGACVQTETVLRQALMERIKPVLMINKVDRFLFEKKYTAAECYLHFKRVIESINVIVATYQPEGIIGDVQFSPEMGTVAFGSGYYAWGFTLNNVADFWAKQKGMDKSKILKRIWKSEKYFVQYVMGPICNLRDLAEDGKRDKVFKFAENVGVKLSNDDKQLTGKKLTNCVLRKWFPASDALLEMIVQKLPSPDTAQQYRAATLYTGPEDDEVSQAIKKCDPDGPLMVYISKQVPDKDKRNFYAFGRVFSGTLRAGKKVNIYGMNYEHGSDVDYIKNVSIQRIHVMMANKMKAIDSCPSGNTVAIAGIDKYLLKSGTISDVPNAHPFHEMKFTVSPVVRVAVSVKHAKDLPDFVKGLERLSKSDPLCQIRADSETGEMVVAGAGELHIDVIMNNLRDDYCKNIPFTVSEPVVPFREAVTTVSNQVCLAKSPNKHNRLYMTAEPLPEELIRDIENGIFDWEKGDKKELCKQLVEKYGFSPNDANPKKIWIVGPGKEGTNMVVDQTVSVQYLNEIKDSVLAAFNNVAEQGLLCEEPMRGIKFNIKDVSLHADTIHRGGGQIIPAARRVFLAAQYTASPCLMEPMFDVDITVPGECISAVYNVVSQRRGEVYEQTLVEGTPMTKLRAYLPVMESFGFDAALRGETSGKAFSQCSFSHWKQMSGSMDTEGSRLYVVVQETRTRKGHNKELPPLDNYVDKL